MKYEIMDEVIPQNKRKEINDKILYLIEHSKCDEASVTKADIFNSYTGIGGLHGLEHKNYDSYYEYSVAKKEFENGQVFTPNFVCKFLIDCLKLDASDTVADLTFGMGNFFNFLPNEANAYGTEIDINAFKVAKHLYPNANLENKDIRVYAPFMKFDYVVGNPPFNLRWWTKEYGETLSELYYLIKSHEVLKPLGILALIVPASFLADDFSDKSMINEFNSRFNFLGQVTLPTNIFKTMGVSNFATKIMFCQKKSEVITSENSEYVADLSISISDFSDKESDEIYQKFLYNAKNKLQQNKSRILLELAKDDNLSKEFIYKINKLMYQIKVHPKLFKYHSKCEAYLYKFQNQKMPSNMEYKEWERIKITEAKVLSYLNRTIKKQCKKPSRDVIELIKNDYSFKFKGYSVKARKALTDTEKQPRNISQAILYDDIGKYPGFEKYLKRKKREYMVQNQIFDFMDSDDNISKWLNDFCIWDKENEEEIRLNDMQKLDINRVLQKKYAILQWEQGCGKTLAGIATGLYRMKMQNVFCTFVVSPAISIKNNWDVVLKNYDIPYIMINKLADFNKIRKGDFVLMTLDRVCKYKRHLKKFIKCKKQNIQLVFDESDEITNPDSVRSKAMLNCFRKSKYKLLDSGTITRNNISEFAPQLELLYNNSINMISWCDTIYKNEKYSKKDGTDKGLHAYQNHYYGKPIPAYKKGYNLFSSSHLPEKVTVFGIGQKTQDIYNANELSDILDKTIITRTFEEISGKDIKRIHQVPVSFSDEERLVYAKAIKEFHSIREDYFNLTGNSKKDSMMVLLQQITMLLRISAAPNSVKEYTGDTPVKIAKVIEMVRSFSDEIVVIGVRHINVLDIYVKAIKNAMPDREIFIVTGSHTTFATRRKLRKTLKESKNGILICTQQSLPSSVNFEYVNKIIIPELHYNNARMSQFYFRFIRYTSTNYKDIYFVTYGGSIESNLMQMVISKEKLNLFMKGKNYNLDEVNKRFGVDYDLYSLLMTREEDDEGKFHIRWGEQNIIDVPNTIN